MRPRHRPYHTSVSSSGFAAASSLAYGVGGLALAAATVAAVVAYSTLSQKQRRRSGVTREQWEAAVTESGAVAAFDSILHDVAQRGLEPEVRADVWPFLLGVFAPDSTYEERRKQHAVMAQQHQQLLLQCQALEAALRDCVRQQRDAAGADGGGGGGAVVGGYVEGLHAAQQQQQQQQAQQQLTSPLPPFEMPAQVVQFAEAHRIVVIDAVRTDFRKHSVAAIYSSAAAAAAAGAAAAAAAAGVAVAAGYPGGIEPGGTPRAAGSTLFGPEPQEDDPALSSWVSGWLGGRSGGGAVWGPAHRLWVSEAAQRVLDTSGHLGEEGRRQAARLIALLTAYAVYDPETGYCQGMSDLAMPLLVLLEDDALAFWCFAALMRTFGARGNFAVDESGIFSQLRALSGVLARSDRVLSHKLRAMGAADCHFAYRMVVVMMRRDMPLAQAMTLWEVLWADARKQLMQRRIKSRTPAPSHGGRGAPLIAADAGGDDEGDDDDDPKAALRRAASAKAGALAPGAAGDDEEAAGFLSAAAAELFVHFVAAVVIGQRRRVLDDCADQDDAMRLFHSIKGVAFWECVGRAQVLRAAGASRKHR